MKILLLGGSGLVGSRFIDLYGSEYQIDSPTHNDLDVLNDHEIQSYLEKSDAEVIINFVAFTNVDKAEDEKDYTEGQVYLLNAIIPGTIARLAKSTQKHLIHVSTDYVFDGTKDDSPYTESDTPNPVNWYAQTKYYGEQNLLEENPDSSVIRIEMPYSRDFGKKNDFARFFVQMLSEGKSFKAVNDQNITPVFIDHCVAAFKAIAEKKPSGIYHVTSTDWITPHDFALKIAEIKGYDKSLIESSTFEEFNQGRNAPRPKHSWMATGKFVSEFGGGILHTNEESIRSFLEINSGK